LKHQFCVNEQSKSVNISTLDPTSLHLAQIQDKLVAIRTRKKL
jgi:hypothetical protein